MDSISTAELLEFAILSRESLDDQFQYWLTITFAVIVASFAAGEKLNRSWRLTISFLYLLTTILFFVRNYVDAQHFRFYISAFLDRGGEWDMRFALVLAVLRISAYVAGTIITLTFIYGAGKSGKDAA